MNSQELEDLKSWLWSEIERRRHLGGYSQEAESILNCFEVLYKITCHLRPDRKK